MSDFLEKTLEDMIFENLETVQKRGFPQTYSNIARQFPLPSGKEMDLFSFDVVNNELHCAIFELKKEAIDVAALIQVLGYGEEVFVCASPSFKVVSIDLFLIGSDYSNDIKLIINQFIGVELYRYKYEVNGLSFTRKIPFYEIQPTEVPEALFKTSKPSSKFYNRILDLASKKPSIIQ